MKKTLLILLCIIYNTTGSGLNALEKTGSHYGRSGIFRAAPDKTPVGARERSALRGQLLHGQP